MGHAKNPKSREELAKILQKEGITIHVSRTAEGRIFGITYVDHQNKAVFKGSDLGKENGGKGALDRIGNNDKEIELPAKEIPTPAKESQQHKTIPGEQEKDVAQRSNAEKSFIPKITLRNTGKLIEQAIQPEGNSSANNELNPRRKTQTKAAT
jgi:hypothetical protein